jgi:hypothetical protein
VSFIKWIHRIIWELLPAFQSEILKDHRMAVAASHKPIASLCSYFKEIPTIRPKSFFYLFLQSI